jgi:hypothetical protein
MYLSAAGANLKMTVNKQPMGVIQRYEVLVKRARIKNTLNEISDNLECLNSAMEASNPAVEVIKANLSPHERMLLAMKVLTLLKTAFDEKYKDPVIE